MSSDMLSSLELQLERRNEELISIIEIGKALTSSLEIHEVLEIIMKKVERLIKPKIWSLLLKDLETGDLTFEIVVSPVAEKLKELRIKQGEGIAGWVALHGQPLLVPDVHDDDRFADQFDRDSKFATRSIVCVPMKMNNDVVGVIELINSFEEPCFQESDVALISLIADFAAIAIGNARNYERINELVVTDDLTGLYNSRHFGQLIENEIGRARRYGEDLSLIFLDLDHFKSINDRHGHLVGSRMLSECGKLIGRSIRSSDIAARYGGDEFVIILPHTRKEQALALAGKLLDKIRHTEFVSDENERIYLSASFGVAAYPCDADSRSKLIRAADIAMYDAKDAGRSGVRGFGAGGTVSSPLTGIL